MTDVNVLFVCTANICRSAYAQVRAEQIAAGLPGLTVKSAGTWGFDAAPLDQEMALQATSRGLDPAAFRSRRLSAADVRAADVVLTAGSEHRTFILEDWPFAFRRTFTLGQFAESIRSVDPALHGTDLIKAAAATRVPPRDETDIKDPYRRGPEAAAACAAQIDDLLAEVLPRLAG